MEYSTDLVRKYMKQGQEAHDAIMELYNETLYEDTWDATVIAEFENLLSLFSEAIEALDELVPLIHWNDVKNKMQFMRYYNDVFKADLRVYKLVKVRHDAYLTYRKFRKAIITNLNEAIGFVKNKGQLELLEVFEYFNDTCANVPLYDNHNEAGDVTVFEKTHLYDWFFNNIRRRCDEVNESPRTSANYSPEDIKKVFKGYYEARVAVFSIFNMLTSSDPDNGYDRYHNILQSFITASIKNGKELKQLYNATNIDDTFSLTDDYQQTMDDRAWNRKGIYENKSVNESWFTDDLNDYNQLVRSKRAKDKISKINMIGTDVNACNVRTDGKHVYAGTTFYPNDIIEICPTRKIDKSSLYSRDMREIAFEVVPNEEWVLPFGYCQYYDIEGEPNCSFIWDPVKRVIVIRAINKIPKLSRLVLKINN